MSDSRETTLKKRFKERRLTPQRRLILDLFLKYRGEHLSAEEIYQFLQERKSHVGMATVYRTLDLLVELGFLKKHHFGDGCSRYESIQISTEHHHHHLVCLNCKKIFEVKKDLLHNLEELIAKDYDFDIVDHNLQFLGYCNCCSGARGLVKEQADGEE